MCRRSGARRRRCRVAHERVQAAEPRARRIDGGSPVLLLRHVEMLVPRGVADLGGDRGTGVVENVTEHDTRAFGRELARLRLALPARRAGHEHDLAVQPAGHRRTVALAGGDRNWEREAVPVPDVVVQGECDSAFARVRDAFAANFAAGLELGASLCVVVDGRTVVDVWGGWLDAEQRQPWERDSIACVFSCTKGLAAIVLLILVDRGAVDLDAPVARYWPEFAAAGKDTLPVRYLLTHEAGLSAIGKPMPFGSLSDWTAMVSALAQQEPWWEPGSGHGYHGVTFGHLVGEVVRRVDGRTIGAFLHDEITASLGVDCFLGLPASEDARTATMVLAPIEGETFFCAGDPTRSDRSRSGTLPIATTPRTRTRARSAPPKSPPRTWTRTPACWRASTPRSARARSFRRTCSPMRAVCTSTGPTS